MTTRRSFLKTVSALGVALLLPVGRLLGMKPTAKLVINGIALELPPQLDIVLECPASGIEMGPIQLVIRGGKLRVDNREGPAVLVRSEDRGSVELGGSHYSIEVRNDSGLDNPPTIVLCPKMVDPYPTEYEQLTPPVPGVAYEIQK